MGGGSGWLPCSQCWLSGVGPGQFNVAVPFVDEDVKPGWWREPADGGVADEVEDFIFPDLPIAVHSRYDKKGSLEQMGKWS